MIKSVQEYYDIMIVCHNKRLQTVVSHLVSSLVEGMIEICNGRRRLRHEYVDQIKGGRMCVKTLSSEGTKLQGLRRIERSL